MQRDKINTGVEERNKRGVIMRIFIINIIVSIICGLFFLPLWYTRPSETALLQDIFGWILPLFLCVLNAILFLKWKIVPFKVFYVIMPVSAVIYYVIGYLNRGITFSRLFRPDWEGLAWMGFFLFWSIVISLVLCGISNLIFFFTKKL